MLSGIGFTFEIIRQMSRDYYNVIGVRCMCRSTVWYRGYCCSYKQTQILLVSIQVKCASETH
jgi:hypothetical protein